MKRELLYYLCCPYTGNPLELVEIKAEGKEIIEGKLIDRIGGRVFPIVRGVPRFVPSDKEIDTNYTASFGHQWLAFNWLRQEDQSEFEAITDRPVSYFKNKLIFDAGCGGGRIARFLAPLAKLYIGVDYSVACEKARELCRDLDHAHFIQADLNHLPFKKQGLFDFIFSHGVLHHTPDTKKSFLNLPVLVKQGGELYVAVFRKTFYPLRIVDSLTRCLVNKLSKPAQERICQGLVKLQELPYSHFWKRFFWFSLQKDKEVAKCCNFDWYAPRYHNEHSVAEVMAWFKEAGLDDMRYIDAWPYCPAKDKYRVPGFGDSFRLGQLLGVIGRKI